MAETVPVGVVVVDRDGRIAFANAAAEEILGLQRSEMAGRAYNDPAWRITAVDGGPFPEEELPFARVMTTGKAVREVEHAIVFPDGKRVILSINAAPLHGADGGVAGMIASISDVTERKAEEHEASEEELRRKEQYWLAIIRNAPDMITVLDGDLNFRWGSPSAKEITGHGSEEILGRSILDFVHPEDLGYARNALDYLLNNPGSIMRVEFRFRHRDGAFRHHEGVFVNAMDDPYVEGIICNTRDVSDRKRLEEEISRSLERLEVLHEIDADILEARSPAETAQAALRRLRGLVRCRRADVYLIDMDAMEIENLGLDTDGDASLGPGTRISIEGDRFFESLSGGEIVIINADDMPVSHIAAAKMKAEGIKSAVVAPLVAHGELIGLLSIKWDEQSARSFTDAEVDIIREVASHLAVALYNARLFEEVQKYASELELHVEERTARLEEVNRELEAFSYSVSHDLRAPLRAVDGFSQALLEDYGERLDETGKQFIARIRAGARRMAELIDDILTLSRVARSEMRREPVDISAMAAMIVDELKEKEPSRRVEVTVEPGLMVSGDPKLLRLVLTNLLDNAFKFTRGRDPARVEFGSEVVGGERAFFVRDNGAGFDMRYADKLFGAFQRLHSTEEFPGTGVGLAIAQRVVHRHGGRIWGRGAPGEGAVFHFTIPEG